MTWWRGCMGSSGYRYTKFPWMNGSLTMYEKEFPIEAINTVVG